MTRMPAVDPDLDLVLERVVDARPELVWKAWTEPEHLKKWFTPAPWETVDCEIDLRPGGIFSVTMRSPEGDGTRYTAIAMHADEAGRKRHAEMGFHEGWGAALDQLVELAKELEQKSGGETS